VLGFGGIVGASIRYNLYKDKIDYTDDKKRLKKSISLLLISTISGVGFLSLLVLSNIFPTSQLLNDDIKLKFVLIICAILFPVYILAVTVKPPIKEKRWLGLEFSLISAMDYLTSGVVLYAAMRFLNINISFVDMESIFIVATVAGIMSMIPGGIGSFDLIFLLGATRELNIDSSSVLIALFLYRISYYFIPFIIALILGTNELQKRVDLKSNKFIIVSREFSSIIFSISIKQIKQINRMIGSFIFVMGAYYFIMYSEFFLYLSAFGYIQNNIELVVYAIYISCSILLFTNTYGLFKGSLETLKRVKRILMILFICEIYILIQYHVVAIFSLVPFAILGVLVIFFNLLKKQSEVECVKSSKYEKLWLVVADSYILYSVLLNHYLNNNVYVILIVLILSNIYFFISREYHRKKLVLESTDKNTAKELLEKFGGNNLSHLLYLTDNKFFVDSELEVGIIFQENKHNIFILGDPVGNLENLFEFLKRILTVANRKGKYLVFYQTSTKFLNFYSELNFNIFKLGEEGIIDLKNWSLTGKRKRGFRATWNQAEKLEYDFEMIEPPIENNVYRELAEISDEWLAGREEMTFSVGRYEKSYLNSSSIGILKEKDTNKIIGFVSLMPMYIDHTISIDLIRWKENKDIAMMDLLYLKLLHWAQKQKFCYFNLGMAPLSSTYENNSTWKNLIFSSVYSNSKHFYSFKGLRNYKEKFKPIWEGKYLVYNKKSLLMTLYDCYSIIHKK
ncbi:TPA: lysylphosphatidylglycerol synthetase family protein, partial [Enterococcus faecalis]|nr:lysylphosphatidylglycerol synthetase family protein [Enterococcus faecalis]